MDKSILRVIIAVLLVAFLVGLFIFTFLLNKKTPKPEGCENIDENCEGCQMTSCSHYKKNNQEKEG